MKIKWNWQIINKAFWPLIQNKDRYLILYGGRGSSKSDFAAKRLIYECLTQTHFRCIMIRRVGAKVKDSCYQNIKDLTIEMGIYNLFEFTSSPTPKIVCKHNQNFFIGAGLDDTTKIKSIKDPSAVWWEEDVPEESDFITITTSIRTLKADYIQEIFSINPEVKGDYREHWFYKRFFKDKYEQGVYSFSDKTKMELNGKQIQVPYTVHHSTHIDNPHLPDEFRAVLIDLKKSNPYYYQVYTLGMWGVPKVEGRFYHAFKYDDHVYTGENRYNDELALHISFDFNVRPYMSLSIWQILPNEGGYTARCIEEIAAREPYNNTPGMCTLFKQKYGSHNAGLFIYGDPAGKHEDTRSTERRNDFTIIASELKSMSPQKRLHNAAPVVMTRGNFINEIFRANYEGVKIEIHEKCTNMINDMMFGLVALDGTKYKEKGKNKESGMTEEKYHHFSDGMDYFLTKAFKEQYAKFKRGGVETDYSIPTPLFKFRR